MTVIPPSPEPTREDERARLLDRAQPIRLVSIDDVTIGQLMSLLFKLFIASIPVAMTIGLIWFVLYQMYASVMNSPGH